MREVAVVTLQLEALVSLIESSVDTITKHEKFGTVLYLTSPAGQTFITISNGVHDPIIIGNKVELNTLLAN